MGKRAHSPLYTIVYSPSPTFHASVVVSKKVARLAVDRNKIRRRIYDILRRYQSRTGVTGVCIVLTKATVRGKAYAEMSEDITTQLSRIMK